MTRAPACCASAVVNGNNARATAAPVSDRMAKRSRTLAPSATSGREVKRPSGCREIRRSFLRRRLQRLPHSIRVLVGSVHRRSGLLPPRIIEPSGIDRIEPELVDETHHDFLL